MTKYIRGFIQIKAIFYLMEAVWKILLGLEPRHNLAIKRALELMSGFAKPYGIVVTPTFVESYRKLFGDEATMDFLYRFEKEKAEASE